MKTSNKESKERRGPSTEDRILDAAFDIIQEKTIGALRMRQIAERADVFQTISNTTSSVKRIFSLLFRKSPKSLPLKPSAFHKPSKSRIPVVS